MNKSDETTPGWKQKAWAAMVDYWITSAYLAVFFCVFTTYRRIVLAKYEISYEDWGIGIIKALVLGKVIMVVEHLGVGQRFRNYPLVIPTIYKAVIFTFSLMLFSIAESLLGSFFHGKTVSGALEALVEHCSNYDWFAGFLVVFFAFIPFFAFRELEEYLGKGVIGKLFFKRLPAAESGHGENDP